ncbi:MAG TPA: MXAN_6521/LA_1396 family lipoprotein [Spirochaetota bacterium]|nr:MXAN_6521/LA_1396 family lipoprotein [Spirochaetota bacterium]
MTQLIRRMFPLILMLVTACSTVSSSYISDGYNDDPLKMIKHVSILVYVPDDKNNVAPLVSDIAADMIKLKTNYFVNNVKIVTGDWKRDVKGSEGAIFFTVTNCDVAGNRIKLQMKSELFRSSDWKLLWSASGSAGKKSDDSSLKELTSVYAEKHPVTANLFAAPLFIIIQDFVDVMPDPELTDEEIDQRIKLESGIE